MRRAAARRGLAACARERRGPLPTAGDGARPTRGGRAGAGLSRRSRDGRSAPPRRAADTLVCRLRGALPAGGVGRRDRRGASSVVGEERCRPAVSEAARERSASAARAAGCAPPPPRQPLERPPSARAGACRHDVRRRTRPRESERRRDCAAARSGRRDVRQRSRAAAMRCANSSSAAATRARNHLASRSEGEAPEPISAPHIRLRQGRRLDAQPEAVRANAAELARLDVSWGPQQENASRARRRRVALHARDAPRPQA